MFRRILWLLFGVVSLLVFATYFSLESGGVVTVVTVNNNSGASRSTHVWYVREQGAIALEAGNPNNPWVLDLDGNNSIRLVGEGLDGRYCFALFDDEGSHSRIRSLMRSKYGWRDTWIGLLFDVKQSALVELREC